MAPLYSADSSVRGIWGDELLYLSSLKPLTLTVKYGSGLTDTAQLLSLDRVQFVYLYPTLVPLGAGGQGQGLRLAEWRSQPYILYGSLKDSSNTPAAPRLSKTCEALAGMGYTWAFDVDQAGTPAQAWYHVRAPGGSPMLELDAAGPALAPQGSWAFVDDYEYQQDFFPQPNVDRGQVSRGSGGSSVQPARYVLAFNTVSPTASPSLKTVGLVFQGQALAVPAHALADKNSQVGFPGGFEVAVIGRPLAREVALRHVLMAVAATEPRLPQGTRRASEGLDFVQVRNDN
jgi:hypothetical protein